MVLKEFPGMRSKPNEAETLHPLLPGGLYYKSYFGYLTDRTRAQNINNERNE